jgi:hypothetical protein
VAELPALPDPPETAEPQKFRVPNRTDAAFDELAALRAEAADLGLEGAERESLVGLRRLVEQARAARG